jgi:membrane protein implicated in regulation of membrane protease activity
MRNAVLLGVVTALLLALPGVALAYIGPGAGITAIGTAIALLGAIVLAIVGFVWYPIKRLRAKMKSKRIQEQGDQAAPPS